MNGSVDQCVLGSESKDQPTLGVFFNEVDGKIFVCAGDEDPGHEISLKELPSLYQTYRVCFFDAEKTLSWLKKCGVTVLPKSFDCLVSQNRLTTSGVPLTIESITWYWWEELTPITDAERACRTFGLDDSPDYETLREAGAFTKYQTRIARIADFITGR